MAALIVARVRLRAGCITHELLSFVELFANAPLASGK